MILFIKLNWYEIKYWSHPQTRMENNSYASTAGGAAAPSVPSGPSVPLVAETGDPVPESQLKRVHSNYVPSQVCASSSVHTFYCPQNFSGGGLYLNWIWLLWSVYDWLLWLCLMGYYYVCMMGSAHPSMNCVWRVTMKNGLLLYMGHTSKWQFWVQCPVFWQL